MVVIVKFRHQRNVLCFVGQFLQNFTFARRLSDLVKRSEGKLFLVRFFDHLRRIVSLFNDFIVWNNIMRKLRRGEAQGCAEQNDRGIWQNAISSVDCS